MLGELVCAACVYVTDNNTLFNKILDNQHVCFIHHYRVMLFIYSAVWYGMAIVSLSVRPSVTLHYAEVAKYIIKLFHHER